MAVGLRRKAAEPDTGKAHLLWTEGGSEQQLSFLPVTAHGSIRDSEDGANFELGQTEEVAHFDDLGHPGIEGGELVQRLMDGEQLFRLTVGADESRVQRSFSVLTPTAFGEGGSCQIDDDRAHRTCSVGEEVRSVGGLQGAYSTQFQEALVNQRGGIEQSVPLMGSEARVGHPPQVRIHESEKLGERLALSLAHPIE